MKKLLPFLLPVIVLGGLAVAQDIANHSMPIGGGPGAIGWKTGGPCAAGQALVWSGVTSDPQCISVSGSGSTPGGSNLNIQYNNAGTFGGLTDAQTAARVSPTIVGQVNAWTAANTWAAASTFNGANLYTATNTFRGSVLLGGNGRPFIDVTSGANGCTAAVGANAVVDTAAFQCQLDYMHNTLGGGILFVPKLAGQCFYVNATLAVYYGTTIVGTGRNASCITTNGSDFIALQFISNAGNGGEDSGLRDISIACSQSTAATQGCVFVENNVAAHMSNVRINGGYRALINHGVDGRYYNIYASASATTVASAILFSRGANWYVDCKFDTAVSASDFGVYIYAPYTTSTAQMENHFVNIDVSGPWGSASLAIDDSANPAGVPTAVTWCSGCILSANGAGTVNVIINQAVWSVFTGVAARFYTLGATGGTLTIGNSWGGTSAGGTVTGAGADRFCSNNKNLTC